MLMYEQPCLMPILWYVHFVFQLKRLCQPSPIAIMKAVKTKGEIEGMKKAHVSLFSLGTLHVN